jgi:hypothetical protein
MMEQWVPFGLEEDEVADYEVLVDGVPPWLREPLVGWIDSYLSASGWYDTAKCLDVQLNTRVQLGVSAGSSITDSATTLKRIRSLAPLELLRIVDYVVSEAAYNIESKPALDLDDLLDAGRSKWTVGKRGGRIGLVERVAEGVQSSVEGVIASAGSSGRILARAWSHVHGFQPNDSGGYADAVRAVEIAAIDLVQPNNKNATLGSVVNQMRDQGDWRLPLREHQYAPSSELILNSARTLWHGHRDRHGSVDYSDVTHDEARAAVALAATLVEWFTSGAVARRP